MEVKQQKINTRTIQCGFTLIELLVVVLIISVIATVVIPNIVTDKGQKAREQAEKFAHRLAAIQEESLYQINFFALHINRDRKGHNVWKYAGQLKQQSNVKGVNERFSALNDFNFSLDSQIAENDDDEQGSENWDPVENERFKEIKIDQEVDLSIVEIKRPVRQDYETDKKFEDQLILIDSGIITTPFQVEFKQDEIIYVVKLNEYSEIIVEKLENTF